MFSSTIIPTIGRTTLSRAVDSVLNQEFTVDNFEVIVVNDSGQPLPVADWQRSERVQVLGTNRRERSIARNTGAAVARGKYLHFLDDDDWMAPGALQHFYSLSQISDARWLYGVSQLVDRSNNPLVQLQHGLNGNCFVQVMAGEWIPLQASLIDAQTFFSVGGFNQSITGPEDIDLLRRIALVENLAETSHIVAYIVMGELGSTTDYNQHPQQSQWAREKILESPNNFSRIRSSATSSFWHGRLVRVYLTSIVWNLTRKRFLTAGSRSISTLAGFVLAGTGIFTGEFWRAVGMPYQSETFTRGIQQAKVADD